MMKRFFLSQFSGNLQHFQQGVVSFSIDVQREITEAIGNDVPDAVKIYLISKTLAEITAKAVADLGWVDDGESNETIANILIGDDIPNWLIPSLVLQLNEGRTSFNIWFPVYDDKDNLKGFVAYTDNY